MSLPSASRRAMTAWGEMTMSPPAVAKGSGLSLMCLALMGVMPIVSNLRPAEIGALPFAYALSVWQSVLPLPLFLMELRGGTRGVFELDLPPRKRWRMIAVGVMTGGLFGLSTY